MSSLRRGHANLLCIVPILVYVLPKQVHLWLLLKFPYIRGNMGMSLFLVFWSDLRSALRFFTRLQRHLLYSWDLQCFRCGFLPRVRTWGKLQSLTCKFISYFLSSNWFLQPLKQKPETFRKIWLIVVSVKVMLLQVCFFFFFSKWI